MNIKTLFIQNVSARRVFLAALALVFIALYSCNTLIIAMRSDNAQLRANIRQLAASKRAGEQGGPPTNLAAALAGDAPSIVGEVHQLAQDRELLVSDAKYTIVDKGPDAAIGCTRIEIRMRGGYVELKKFLADVLADHAGLALDSMSIRRGAAVDSKLDMQLEFSLYYRKNI
ncbi:hypothetical protein ACFOLJ_06410 [Rugamonas sp. CCM 8940]|uniref:hypothetical protein n=1 Tax=Rugamonas sp. CCM 8940 TaxID=2765359 RepID=UPI0018F6A2B8|nr:hypothetical protein [Rugamonas sp. CCM 8940]MBJ7310413.1 hypothetical protein [Rugamonas sp. CCM 8940]